MIDCYYRFVNNEIIDWLKNMKKKLSKEIINKNLKIINRNLEIMNNYNIDILEKKSIETFFKYSPKFGLEISICKRNSFHPKLFHIKPYYSKTELIKLGQNMNLLEEINSQKLLDKEIHYKICKKISKNDISIKSLIEHSNFIFNNSIVSIISFYSLNGCFLMNKLLRNFSKESKYYNEIIIENIKTLILQMIKAPGFSKDYYFYRFIWDDDFLSKIKEGDIFIDEGFISSTRDPFYAPGIQHNFGLVLIKIHIPKNIKGIGLLIENYSLFNIEEEFLLPPKSKLKLISKNDNFKYYHINSKFERLVTKKYEFKYIGNETQKLITKLSNIKIKNKYPILDHTVKLEGDTIDDRLKYFINNFTNKFIFYFKLNKYKYKLYCSWFNSTSSYQDYYYNKTNKGLIIKLFENNTITTTIELGNKMVINYLLKFYHSMTTTKKLYQLYLEIGKIFGYKTVQIYNSYKHFEGKDFFSSRLRYNIDLIDIINKKNIYHKFEVYPFGILKLNIILNKVIPDINCKVDKKIKKNNLKKIILLFIKEKEYNYLYQKIDNYLINNYDDEIFMTQLNILDYWNSKNIQYNIYQDKIIDESEINISFNRRRVR